ncbi:MAG TPA: ABC transporter permease [Gemmatimonadaceae bacterium]|nr:ABC transporter permease [Gemmatimonadaceae bacterium]
MPRIPGIRPYLRAGRSNTSVRRQVDDELAFHFAMCVDELVARGMTPEAARAEAEKRFGDVSAVRDRLRRLDAERIGDERRAEWWSALGQDVRYALRGLRRSPGFTVGVVLTLALGIGANAAVFSFIDRLLLRPLPHIVDAANLRRVNVEMTFKNGTSNTRGPMSYPEFAAVQGGVKAFDRIGAFRGPSPIALGRGVDAPRVKYALASGDFFRTLGVQPAAGRFFLPEDDDDRVSRPAAVLGYGLWQRRFSGRADAVGQTIVLDGRAHVIVGVAPKGFSGVDVDAADIWVPLAPGLAAEGPKWRESRMGFGLQVIAHLAPGATPEQATAQANVAIRPAYEGTFIADLPTAVKLGSIIPGRRLDRVDSEISIATRVSGAAAMVLLIACANVANLLLARALARRRELAVRLALGVGRARLVMQLMTESVLLATVAGVAATVLAVWGGSLLRGILMPGVTWASDPVDARVLVFTAVITMVVGVAAGLAPAIQMTRQDLTGSLKSGARDVSTTRSAVRSSLVLVQAAFTVVLLVGAGLFARSLHNARGVDLGFAVDRAILADVSFEQGALKASERGDLFRAMAERLRLVPGVAAASVTTTAPFYTFTYHPLFVPGRDSLPSDVRSPLVNAVATEYLGTMQMRTRLGRGLSADDRAGAPPVVLLNQTLARRLWPDESALGRCVKVMADTSPCLTVVGVVNDVGFQNLHDAPPAQLYLPLAQAPAAFGGMYVVLRGADGTNPRDVAAAARNALRGAHPGIRTIRVTPFLDLLDPEIRPFRLGATMFGVLGGLALALAGVGLYAVISFGVTSRTRELGIRGALGARAGDVVGLVLGEGMRVTAIGVAIGLVAALALGRLVEALLFGASPRDPVVFGLVAGTLLVVAIVASAVPAWRASRVSPMVALRDE